MKRTLILACLLQAAIPNVRSQSMQAVTSPPGPNLKVVVTWPITSVSRFNVYRTPGASGPLNSTPISPMTSCADIQAVIPMGSDDWVRLSQGLAQNNVLFDPCSISTIVPGSNLEQRLEFLARAEWRIAVVAGQAFVDSTVTAGTTYTYQLRGVDALGNETGPVFPDVSVTAGSPVAIAPPPSVSATAGDYRVLVLWGDQTQAAGFLVMRATSAAGPYQQVNAYPMMTRVANGVDGRPLASPSNGFLDIEQWDPNGNPTTHTVSGVAIDGPRDGVTYYYRVSSIDLMGQAGPPSASVSALPIDKTPPATPTGVTVTALDPQSQIEVRWTTSPTDVEGHYDSSGVTGYMVFRYDAENARLATGVQIGGVVAQPSPPDFQLATALDTSGNLRPRYGEKTYWYRVRAVDANGNISAYSAAVGGHLKDITPPDPPKNLTAEGSDTYIELKWSPNTEKDLDHYQIFRSYCDNGKSNPCNPSDGAHAGETPGGNWIARAALPYPASGIFAASDGTYVYCGGGYDGTTVHTDLLRYDPVADSWTPLAPSFDPHYRSQAVYNNGKIYNIGGLGASGVTNTTRIYEITSDTWSLGAPMPVALSDMATVLWNGIIYVAGGHDESGPVNTLYALDGDRWTTLKAMPQALYGPGFGAINGKLYVAGGNDGTNELNTLYIYDIATNTWTNGSNLPWKVTGPGSTVYCGKLYLYGGGIASTINFTQIYDSTSNGWSSGPNLVFNRRWFYGSAVGNTSIVAPGGEPYPSIPNFVDNEQLVGSPCGLTPSPTPTPTATPPCTGEYLPVGSVSLAQAKSMGTRVTFRDLTIPRNSPVCYSYWIKAYDHVQNMSGTWPSPGPNEQTVCQRLRDRTPPDPAIISGLFACESGIRVEWIGAPVQDIRAYQVYRADKEAGPYKFVGGMTVEQPPGVPQVLTSAYKPPPLVNCETIPLIAIDSMSMGAFTDKTAIAKKIYWYKVLGVDQNGNESSVNKAAPMSTFTYTSAPQAGPVITSVTASTSAPFELVISWTPAFDPMNTRGFAVFRSDSQSGLYRQVGSLVKTSEFHDNVVVKNVTYWYKVVRLDVSGLVSRPSSAVSATLGP